MLSLDPNVDYSALPAFANKQNREIDRYVMILFFCVYYLASL
jgi:hypothetical protein